MPCEGSFQLLRGSFLAYLVQLQPGTELPLAYADALNCAPAGQVAFALSAGIWPLEGAVVCAWQPIQVTMAVVKGRRRLSLWVMLVAVWVEDAFP